MSSKKCKFHKKYTEEELAEMPITCRYFCIGFYGTGTKSTTLAALSLGLRAQHGFNSCLRCQLDGFKKMKSGRTDLDVYKMCEYCDDINLVHWKRLAKNYPDSKFVLTTRPIDTWIRSQGRKGKWMKYNKYPNSFWYWYIHQTAGQVPLDRRIWCDNYLKKVKEIRHYFKGSGRMIEVNVWQDGSEYWPRLAKFLDRPCPPPGTPIPRLRHGTIDAETPTLW